MAAFQSFISSLNILNTLRNMAITDFIDIAIATFLIYHLIAFIRKTGSGRLAGGIIALVLLLWLSSLLQLDMINFVLNKVIELGILAIVILFQPEIRRILEHVGGGQVNALLSSPVDELDMEGAIGQTVIACMQMSKSKVGVLIIFERRMRLEEAVQSGTLLDARPSAELFKNIFYDKAPLHDGAVIIRNGRVICAGSMLPLSTNPNLSRDLGMRHRAGIGISEQSDAVAVIVSEETGSISVAVDGMLKRRLAPDTFEKLLRNEMIGMAGKEKSRRFKVGFGRNKKN